MDTGLSMEAPSARAGVCRVADLHTRDGFGNLSHTLDHRNFKVKT